MAGSMWVGKKVSLAVTGPNGFRGQRGTPDRAEHVHDSRTWPLKLWVGSYGKLGGEAEGLARVLIHSR